MKLWDKEAWGFPLVGELRRFINDTMRLYELRRLDLHTPSPPDDERGVRVAKILGFTIEGRQKYGFRWNGKLMTNTMLRKIREV